MGESIGQAGGQGTVFKAWDEELAEHVAVKVLHTEMWGNLVGRDLIMKRIERIQAMKDDFIVPILYAFIVEYEGEPPGRNETLAYVMPLADESLHSMLASRSLTASQLESAMRDTLYGLNTYHEHGLTHNDVCEGNILRYGSRFRLGDPDISTELDGMTHQYTHWMKEAYAAPERIEKHEVRQEGDVWSWGVAYYHALTNKFPYRDGTKLSTQINRRERKIITGCLRGQPETRTTLASLMKMFDDPAADDSVTKMHEPPAQKQRPVLGKRSKRSGAPTREAEVSDRIYVDDYIGAIENPNIPADMLARLSTDPNPAVRAGVARNPNASHNVLDRLSQDQNLSVRVAVAQNPNIPARIIVRLAREESVRICMLLAQRKTCPPKACAMLARKNDEQIRRRLACRRDCPPELLNVLSLDKDVIVRAYIAQNHSTPPEALDRLARDRNELVHSWAIRNPGLPTGTLLKYSGRLRGGERRGAAAANPNMPPDRLAKLSRAHNEHVRRGVGQNPSTSPEILRTLIEDKRFVVRAGLADNPNCPPDLLPNAKRARVRADTLYVNAASPDERLRDATRYNRCSPEVLSLLANDDDSQVRKAIAARLDTPPSTLAKLVEDSDPKVLQALAMNPAVPPETLVQLSCHGDETVRMGVALNENVTPEILNRLLQDSSTYVRRFALRHPSVPLKELTARLPLKYQAYEGSVNTPDNHEPKTPARSPEAIASDPHTSTQELSALVGHKKSSVHVAVAQNPNTPPEALSRLAYNPNIALQLTVASHPNTPGEALARLSKSTVIVIREAVAKHPNTPAATVGELANDPSPTVRRIVESRQGAQTSKPSGTAAAKAPAPKPSAPQTPSNDKRAAKQGRTWLNTVAYVGTGFLAASCSAAIGLTAMGAARGIVVIGHMDANTLRSIQVSALTNASTIAIAAITMAADFALFFNWGARGRIKVMTNARAIVSVLVSVRLAIMAVSAHFILLAIASMIHGGSLGGLIGFIALCLFWSAWGLMVSIKTVYDYAENVKHTPLQIVRYVAGYAASAAALTAFCMLSPLGALITGPIHW